MHELEALRQEVTRLQQRDQSMQLTQQSVLLEQKDALLGEQSATIRHRNPVWKLSSWRSTACCSRRSGAAVSVIWRVRSS